MCRLLLVVIACLCIVGCNAETLGYVKKTKYDTLQKQLDSHLAVGLGHGSKVHFADN